MRRPILDHVLGRLEMQSADFQTIDAYVTSQMQSMHIPGVALGIVHGDKIVHLQRFGVAKPAGQLMTAHTPPCWGRPVNPLPSPSLE